MHRNHHIGTQRHATKNRGKNNLDVIARHRQAQVDQVNVSELAAPYTNKVAVTSIRRRRKSPRKPPFAATQQEVQSSIQDDVMSVIMYPCVLLGSLNKSQLTFLIFLVLIGGAYAIDAANSISKPSDKQNNKTPKPARSPGEKTALKQQAYHEVCTDKSKSTYNKPNMTLGSVKGVLVPKACVIQDVPTCQRHSSMLGQFIPDFTGLQEQRISVSIKHGEWVKSIEGDSVSIQSRQSHKQNVAFVSILASISDLKGSYLSATHSRQAKAGNCGEHANVALTALLNKKLQYGLEMKVQHVSVIASQSTNAIYDHAFLLLDSDINDVSISNDAAGVKMAINQIKQGKICDPWNHGYHADLKTDDSGFYKSDAGWDSLSIKSYSLSFADFKTLSHDAQQFICKQLAQIGLHVEPLETCRMFRKNSQSQGTQSHLHGAQTHQQDLKKLA